MLPEIFEPLLRTSRLAEGVERFWKVGHVAALESCVAGMICESTENLRVAHAQNDRAVAARRLAPNRLGGHVVLFFDERHDLVDDIVLVLPRCGGVDVL